MQGMQISSVDHMNTMLLPSLVTFPFKFLACLMLTELQSLNYVPAIISSQQRFGTLAPYSKLETTTLSFATFQGKFFGIV